MHRAPLRRSALSIAIVLWTFAASGSARAQNLPPDFEFELIFGGLLRPTSFRFLPEGRRVLVTEQNNATVRLFIDGEPAQTGPLFVVPNVRTNHNEQGLLSIAVDPQWPQRPFIYAYYDQESTTRDTRITRYVATGDLDFASDGELIVDARSPLHLITGIPDDAGNHNGGDLRFGPDGMLYFSMGDDEGTRCLAQQLDSPLGKILRLRVDHLDAARTGTVALSELEPDDGLNPFPDEGEVGALVWAYGLRNPVRFGLNAAGSIFVCDVGHTQWEEISHVDAAAPGVNLGWPYREADVKGIANINNCPEPAGFSYQSPIDAYTHTGQGGLSILGGVVYEPTGGLPGTFPVEYHGDVFYAEFYQRWIVRLDGSGQSYAPQGPFVSGDRWATSIGSSPGPVDFAVGPDDALYILELGDGGLYRIRYTANDIELDASMGELKWLYETPPEEEETESDG